MDLPQTLREKTIDALFVSTQDPHLAKLDWYLDGLIFRICELNQIIPINDSAHNKSPSRPSSQTPLYTLATSLHGLKAVFLWNHHQENLPTDKKRLLALLRSPALCLKIERLGVSKDLEKSWEHKPLRGEDFSLHWVNFS